MLVAGLLFTVVTAWAGTDLPDVLGLQGVRPPSVGVLIIVLAIGLQFQLKWLAILLSVISAPIAVAMAIASIFFVQDRLAGRVFAGMSLMLGIPLLVTALFWAELE